MKKKRSTQGSALLLAVIVVLLAAGLGGSFLIVNLSNSRTQQNMSDQDELMAMCDAGLERAKQALDIYRGDYKPTPTWTMQTGGQTWAWNEILTYCWANLPSQTRTKLTVGGVVQYQDPPDMHDIMEDALKAMNDPTHAQYGQFKNYTGTVAWTSKETNTSLWGKNTPYAELTVPANKTVPNASHPINNKTFIGWNIPFHKGAIHIYVHNNGGQKTDSAGVVQTHPTLGVPCIDTQFQELDDVICITVTATLRSGPKAAQSRMGGIVRQVEALYRRPPIPPVTPSQGPQFAAVTSADTLDTLGNVSIDGRDWTADGSKVVGAGVYGLLSMKKITVGGSSAIGGSGNAPPGKGAAAGSTMANGASKFPDGYPKNPDEVMKSASGNLKLAAIAMGTYFTSESAYNAAMPAGGWSGKIVYADFDPTPSFNVGGSAYNANPSILIIHNDAGTSSVKNTKGYFKGLIIADEINHTSAPGGWLGAAFLLSPTAASGANTFGTGNTPIRFSSEVLNNLPSVTAALVKNEPSSLVSVRRVQ